MCGPFLWLIQSMGTAPLIVPRALRGNAAQDAPRPIL
ncbi:hypothetical protein AB7M18_004779 [Pseudomonas viridiflava]